MFIALPGTLQLSLLGVGPSLFMKLCPACDGRSPHKGLNPTTLKRRMHTSAEGVTEILQGLVSC